MTNRYFIRTADVPSYHPVNHTGTVKPASWAASRLP
jgi:hypothetical protein